MNVSKNASKIIIYRFLSPKTFATSSAFFWKYQDKLITANIKLDVLAIRQFPENFPFPEYVKFDSMFGLLNKLYERGFYRKLHLHFDEEINQEIINRLANVNGLVKLTYIFFRAIPFIFSALKNLEELMILAEAVADLEMLPNDLINLKCIHLYFPSIDNIVPFVKHSVEMNKIRIYTTK